MTRDDLGERLRLLREEAGLTQRDVAIELETAEVTISRWESGSHTPQMRNLRKLAKLYGVELHYLRRGGETPPPLSVEQAANAIRQVRELLRDHPELAEPLLADLRGDGPTPPAEA